MRQTLCRSYSIMVMSVGSRKPNRPWSCHSLYVEASGSYPNLQDHSSGVSGDYSPSNMPATWAFTTNVSSYAWGFAPLQRNFLCALFSFQKRSGIGVWLLKAPCWRGTPLMVTLDASQDSSPTPSGNYISFTIMKEWLNPWEVLTLQEKPPDTYSQLPRIKQSKWQLDRNGV